MQPLLAGKVEDAERGADDPAVEAHAAVPQLQDVERIVEIIAEIVEQDVAEPAAEDDPERGVEDQVVGMAPGHRRAGLLEQFEQIPIADEDAGEVGEAVPAQLEEAEVERDRRQAEVGEGDRVGRLLVIIGVTNGLPPRLCRLIRWGRRKAKE